MFELFICIVSVLALVGMCVIVSECVDAYEQGKKDRQKKKEKELEDLILKILEVMKKEVE